MKHDVFIGGLSPDTSEDDIRAHLMDLQVKHIVSIAKLTTNVPRVAAFRVTITDDTIKHNVFNPINFQQGIRIMPFRYYENVKLDDMTLRNTKIFLHILESSGLQQHIHEPTHHLGHMLDVIISRDTSSILTDVEVVDIGLCNENEVTIRDHYAVTSTLKHAMPRAVKKLVNYRKLQSIDIPSFCEDIATSLMKLLQGPSVNSPRNT